MEHAAGQPEGPLWVPATLITSPSSGARPKSGKQLYQAWFNWDHWGHLREAQTRYAHLGFPSATEPCGSVSTVFLLVMRTVYAAERLRGDHSRNILRLLAAESRVETKIFRLPPNRGATGKLSTIEDDEGCQYSTFLSRNKTRLSDQRMALVVWDNLEYLSLCPCLVDFTVLEQRRSKQPLYLSAGQSACSCRNSQPPGATEGSQAREAVAPNFFRQLLPQTSNSLTSQARPPDSRYRRTYQAAFCWEHHPKARALDGRVELPSLTPSSRSAPKAFIAVTRVLFQVEQMVADNPRNILQLLAAAPGQTKVVNVYSSGYRVPNRALSVADSENRHYSTILEYSSESNHHDLPAAVFYNLGYLGLCPCLVDIIIQDTNMPAQRHANYPTVISAGWEACTCDHSHQNAEGVAGEDCGLEPMKCLHQPADFFASDSGSMSVNTAEEDAGPDLLEWLRQCDENGSGLLDVLQEVAEPVTMGEPMEERQRANGVVVSEGESGIHEAMLESSGLIDIDALLAPIEPDLSPGLAL